MRAELERRLAVLVEPVAREVLDGVREFESDPDRVRVELGLIPVFADERPLMGLAGLLDWRSGGRLSAVLRSSFFVGAWAERLLTPGERRWPFDRLVVVGLGARAEFDEARAREFGSRCIEIATGLDVDTVLIALPSVAIDRGLVELAFESLLDAISQRGAEPAAPEPAIPEPAEPELTAEPDTEPDTVAEPEPEPAPESQPEPPADGPKAEHRSEPRWWVVADESVVARLRRVRSGPPRAARGGPSLYT